jgi:uncharacterized protein YjbI with pentapeptide repeats
MRKEHESIFLTGVKPWNLWRQNQFWFAQVDLSGITYTGNLSGIDLRDADLSGANLCGANLNGADLRDARLTATNLESAQLVGCDLRGARLDNANLKYANLEGGRLDIPDASDITLRRADRFMRRHATTVTSLQNACLVGANLNRIQGERLCAEQANFAGAKLRSANVPSANLRAARFNGAECTGANFRGASFDFASLVAADFTQADLSECSVFGISAWDIVLTKADQRNIRITPSGSHPIIVDSIELAQFMYLLLNNRKIRDFVDTISTKLVLILGRFTEARKAVLEKVRSYVRVAGYIPVLVDFEKPENRDLTETISTIAHLSHLVIADLTDPRSVPHELARIIPSLPSVRFQPICSADDSEYGVFEHFKTLSWVSPTIYYDSVLALEGELHKVLPSYV